MIATPARKTKHDVAASWNLTLEFQSDDGTKQLDLKIQRQGNWNADHSDRPVDECLAADLGDLIRALHRSQLYKPGGPAGVIATITEALKVAG